MLMPNRVKSAAFVAITLLLAACSADSEPVAEIGQPDGQDDQPAEAKTTLSEVPSAVAATYTSAPTATAEPTPSPQPTAPFRDLGPAPEIANEIWLNTDRPLPLASLRGQVVLVEFWTFG